MNTLMERCYAGFTVELVLDDNGTLFVTGATEQHADGIEVAPGRALEAFWHPCSLIPDSHLFFARKRADELTDDSDEEVELQDFREYGGETLTDYEDGA